MATTARHPQRHQRHPHRRQRWWLHRLHRRRQLHCPRPSPYSRVGIAQISITNYLVGPNPSSMDVHCVVQLPRRSGCLLFRVDALAYLGSLRSFGAVPLSTFLEQRCQNCGCRFSDAPLLETAFTNAQRSVATYNQRSGLPCYGRAFCRAP